MPGDANFSLRARIQSVRDSMAGIRTLVASQHNAWIHGVAALTVCGAGTLFAISRIEWCLVVVAITVVWLAEALNTALELLCDAVSPGFHPLVGKAKDVGAGAVLISCVGAATLGCIVFVPHVFSLWWADVGNDGMVGLRQPAAPPGGAVPHEQTWDPAGYARNARFVSDLGMPVFELLAARPEERILDLGCGDGDLTEKLVTLGCQVVAVDTSAEQVAAARGRGIDARVCDGQELAFDAEFDAVFSNAAMHWMTRPDDVLRGVRRALKSGGRFVGEFGGHGCVATIESALRAGLERRGIDPHGVQPWYFPTDSQYREKLEGHGFAISSLALIPRPTKLPGDIVGWLETFAGSFAGPLPEAERLGYFAEVREALRARLCDASGDWTADYVRLRFAAHRQEIHVA